ncbi:hypothetical protein [Mesorhizobium caraganae]|uniref:hypothetical protein n=1 Tax=Mesorhizobium caraganae TaxID=483206 RepID=UPI003ECD9B6C
MADQGRQGEEWDAGELDVIIADYFAMLGDELAQRLYVKAHYRAALMQRIGRSAGSIERKHQNISAVLMELGLPWIWGYKPLPTIRTPWLRLSTDTSRSTVDCSNCNPSRRQWR